MIKTAIIGASGYIGRQLLSSYRQTFSDCLGTAFSGTSSDLTQFDIRRPDTEPLRLAENGYEAVLVAAAKPNIDYCEREQQAAYDVNVRGTLELIEQLAKTGIQVIFLSTDYVFEGTMGGYDDATSPAPTTEYGRQKTIVEGKIPELSDNFLIVRLSKVFGLIRNDGTLLEEMAGRLCSGQEVLAAYDQVFCPTFVGDVVRGVQALQARKIRGIVNLCSPEVWSRYDLALAIAKALNSNQQLVRRISLSDLPTAGPRPTNTSLVCKRLEDEVGLSFTNTNECIARVAANWADAVAEQ